jgi:diguanylate cyclase (GGDEF)-like protein
VTRPIVFFVDDEPSITSALKRLFHGSPIEMRSFDSGAAALEGLEKERPDVIVSDYRMPSMNGVELLNEFKDRSPDSVRILLTGFIDIDAALDAINRGSVYRFFKKPWDEAELEAGILEAASIGVTARTTRALPSYLRELITAETPGEAQRMAAAFLTSPTNLGVKSVLFDSGDDESEAGATDGDIRFNSGGAAPSIVRVELGEATRALFRTPKDKAILESIVGSVLEASRIATEAAKARTEILILSEHDQLSGIYNRRAMEKSLRTEWERFKRFGKLFSVILLDIDDFKQINDTCGHETGDRVIEAVGGALKECCRAIDSPGRYGGDEFLVILPETSKDSAGIVAGRIAKRAREIGEGLNLPAGLTLSIGIADSGAKELETSSGDSAKVVSLADAAMYLVKRSGKNGIGTA